jgi:hypothetical protein
MAKTTALLKEFTITMSPEEVQRILTEHIRIEYGYKVNRVIFDIKEDSDQYGNYSGQILETVILKGKLN